MKIESSRLLLKSLTLYDLSKLSKTQNLVNENINLIDFEVSEVQKRAINIKINKMQKADSKLHDWYTYWLIVNKKNLIAMGFIGFKGISNDGITEIGYGISKQFEGKGYMTEAMETLLKWAFKDNRCKKITATRVLRTNFGSQKVLVNNGFNKISESEDTIDYELKKVSNK